MQAVPLAAAIIPAFNEAGRIERVLCVLRRAACVGEIIVVDDGSSDDTFGAARRAAEGDARVRILRLETNQGKQAAMFAGARAARSPYLLFLDADLIGLNDEHVEALVWPVRYKRADMTVGLFRHGRWHTDMSHRLTPFLSGQRCLTAQRFREVMAHASGSGYGIETAITLVAARGRWRRQTVMLEGVTHPSSEVHRGWLEGIARRSRMYAQIAGTWLGQRGWQVLPRMPLAVRLVMLLAMIAVANSLAYNQTLASTPVQVSDLAELSLEGVERLMIVAPHPDDETLGAAGLIQAALSQGSRVHVVVVTNGDGQGLAPLALRGNLRPKPADYVTNGEIRQREALAALRRLGLPASSVAFLGYPDGAIERLWQNSWTSSCPVEAAFTRATASPYSLTHNPDARYCGDDLLADLEGLFGRFKPDLVLLPHPHDDHADHRATAAFSRLALARIGFSDKAFHPQVWGYLVHYGDFPQPRGRRLSTQIAPPLPLLRDSDDWARLDLSDEQVQAKASALAAYATQQRLLGAFLYSFARQNEVFVRLPVFNEPEFALGEAPMLGPLAWHAVREPARESARRLLLQGADLVELRVARMGDQVWVSAVTRGPLIDRLQYEVLIKTDAGHTESVRYPGQAERTGMNAITGTWSLEELGSPDMLAISARVRQGGSLDLSAWHLINLTDLPGPDEEH
jgi:N-acetyl-1-D-myo-inositol-2-amino-2-deoxy-alpha-D-glucopyranoside deacetylase